MNETKPADFETMLNELETVVGKLEGELKLEEALTLFERGLLLSKDCEQFLRSAENKIEVLRRTATGVHTEPANLPELTAAAQTAATGE